MICVQININRNNGLTIVMVLGEIQLNKIFFCNQKITLAGSNFQLAWELPLNPNKFNGVIRFSVR